MCCRHVKIHNVFLRNSDDCIALYNHRWWYWGGSSDFDISRATLWCDWAHPVNIGTHGDDRSETGETLENVRIHDCDILFHVGDGMLTIGCGDKNTIRDVTYDSIRIEDVPKAACSRCAWITVKSITVRRATVSKMSVSAIFR